MTYITGTQIANQELSGLTVLYDQTLAANDAFDIQNIPQGYRNLLIVGQVRTTESAIISAIITRFNGDSGSNYDYQYIIGRNTTASVIDAQAASFIFIGCPGASAGAGVFGSFMALIPNYAATVAEKSISAFGGYSDEAATGGESGTYTGHWRNTAAITSIQMIGNATGLFLAGSRLTVYGLGGFSLATGKDGWEKDVVPWTYASSTTFTVDNDQTVKFSKGTRIKLIQSGAVKYFVVVGSSYSSGTTTVTVTGGSDYSLANAAITDNYYSYQSNPQGYPEWFAWSASPTGFSSISSSLYEFKLDGRLCTMVFYVNGTSNATTFTFTAPITAINTINLPVRCSDNGSSQANPGQLELSFNDTTVTCYKTLTNGAWTASGGKSINAIAQYRI